MDKKIEELYKELLNQSRAYHRSPNEDNLGLIAIAIAVDNLASAIKQAVGNIQINQEVTIPDGKGN